MTHERVLQVIDSIREHRRKLEEFCRSLSEEELGRTVPESTWRLQDFVVHLGTFDVEMMRWLDGLMAGRKDAPALDAEGKPLDIDRWNNAMVEERRDWSLEQVLEEAAANRKRLIERLERLEESHVEQVMRFPGDNKRDPADVPFKLFLAGWSRHDPIHVADMVKALPERADDPDLRAWLDDPAVKWYQDAMSGPPRR
jgi:uncharacterized damage-inducible protein DinB